MSGQGAGFDFAAFKEAFERKDARRWAGFYAEDAEWIEYKPSAPPKDPVRMLGRERIAGFLASIEGSGIEITVSDEVLGGERAAFPDLSFSVEDVVADGDKVVTRWTVRGTHQGEVEDFGPPTGRRIEQEGITIHRIEDGKIVEEWERYNLLGFLQQLGLAPEQE